MFKPTPNPPPSVYTIAADIDDEALMINTFETLTLAIHQLSVLGTQMVGKMLDRHTPVS